MRLLTLFLCLSVTAHAVEPITAHYLRALARARTMESVRQLTDEFERWRVAQTACQIELRENRLPLNCFEAAHLEDRVAPDPSRLRERLRHLTRLCSAALNSLQNLPDPSDYLTEECSRSLSEARSLKAYRDEDSWSEY